MCIERIFYGKGKRAYEILAPSLSEIESAVSAIDGEQLQGVHLELPRGRLTISGDTSNRVQVIYMAKKGDTTDIGGWHGMLTDPQCSEEDGMIEMTLSGMYDEIPLYQTVEKTVVLHVLKHYSEHCRFPDDVVWKRW